MSISEALITDFHEEAANTRRVLEAVPEDKLDWKPHEKSMSLGALAGHIAETPAWVHGMIPDVFDFAVAAEGYKPFAPQSKTELMETFEKHLPSFAELLQGRDDDFMARTWTMKQGDQVLMEAPRGAAIRSIAIHHTIHHRGQLTVYLRLLGVAVPGTYGPTADDAPPA